MPSTTYDVLINAKFNNSALSGAEKLHAGLDKVAHSASGLQHELWNIARRGVESAFEKGVHALIGFNAEMEQTKIGLAAMMEMNLGGTFEQAQAQAEKLFTEFQNFSKLTPVTTREMTEFSRGVASAVFGATGKYQDLINVTEQGVIASKVFGVESQLAQIQLSEMLQGNIRRTERFAMMLLNAGHMSAEAFKGLDAKGRLTFVKDVLNSDAMKEATKAFSESFAGVTSTLKDNIEIALGKVGLPLFRGVTAEIKHWNEWIEKNGRMLEKTGKDFSESLVHGFSMAKDMVSFILDHREALLAVGAAFVAGDPFSGATGKMVGKGMGRGLAGFGIAQMMGGDLLQSSATGVLAAMTALPGPLGNVALAATAAAGGLLALSAELDRHTEKRAQEQAKSQGIVDWAEKMQQGKFFGGTNEAMLHSILDVAKREGFLTSAGSVDQKRLLQSMGFTPKSDAEGNALLSPGVERMLTGGMTAGEAMQVRHGDITAGDAESQRALQAMSAVIVASLPEQAKVTAKWLEAFDAFNTLLRGAAGNESFGLNMSKVVLPAQPEKPKFNITIQHLEIQSDDPDRIMFGIIEMARTAVTNPGQARDVLHEG